MRFLFTCGGTAGHINPALGVAGRIRELLPDAEFLFVGAQGQMETELVPREGFELRTVRVAGLQRGFTPRKLLQNLKAAYLVISSQTQARRILREYRPDVAVGTGGYVCYPVLKAAASMGIPTAVHESNAVPGLTTRRLERCVSRIMVGFESSAAHYSDPAKVSFTGTPVRVDFGREEQASAREQLGVPPQEPLVLAVFGSLGAGYMNDVMTDLIRLMGDKPPFRLLWATGKRYYPGVMRALASMEPLPMRVDVREYVYDMPRQMAAADVVICRSGASTISELTCLGKPAVIVPSPNVVNHHQEKNAAVLGDAGAARVLLEGQFGANELLAVVRSLLGDEQRAQAMAAASAAMGVPDAADRIASVVLGLAQSHKMM